MNLESVKLKNFRGYAAEITIPISNLTAFIGKNDAGKSTILEALEIFFNNKIVVCEREDLSKNADSTNIEISCVFNNFPEVIVIDAAAPTTLAAEHLLNAEGKLEIKKVYPATAAKPKEKVFIVCNHPSSANANDLMELKRAELRKRADDLGIDANIYNRNVNSAIREAIWQHIGVLNLAPTELLVDKEDSKKVYNAIENYLPIYALFQSDRQSNDEDKEVTDPMKIAVQQALQELEDELEYIKTQVRNKAIETANRTLAKLKEMAPDLAEELIPDFRTDPKFDTQFKLTIKSEGDIPINKRGSGVRRLILLNFFRAEAEKRRLENVGDRIIYAFEEPETSQHPNHQDLLIKAFIELSNVPNTQIILTTHTPALAGLLPLPSLRFIDNVESVRNIELGTDNVFHKIADTLGLLPDPISNTAKALLLVEGKSDVSFVNHTSQTLKDAGLITHTYAEKEFAIVPIGGCGNLKHWRTLQLAEQFNIPWCILLDSDRGTPEEAINTTAVAELQTLGIKAYVTRKREPENYIHLSILGLGADHPLVYSDIDDAKLLISNATITKKDFVLDRYWPSMTAELIREVETYNDGTEKYEFTDMFTDFISIC
ncbi:AAA family ATPase [Sphingobacterium bovisgrunnientis]|uniref:AAA family ATPase n=1 Tax=Sphingobacterium bovisgrunnientis TaxID=1874697 RepID=UPI0013585308|nr:AAA family ATPase [Sphingobacterium bovisgrunnientis]